MKKSTYKHLIWITFQVTIILSADLETLFFYCGQLGQWYLFCCSTLCGHWVKIGMPRNCHPSNQFTFIKKVLSDQRKHVLICSSWSWDRQDLMVSLHPPPWHHYHHRWFTGCPTIGLTMVWFVAESQADSHALSVTRDFFFIQPAHPVERLTWVWEVASTTARRKQGRRSCCATAIKCYFRQLRSQTKSRPATASGESPMSERVGLIR